MKKKNSKKPNPIFIFPALFLAFPILFFFALSMIRYINTGLFNYSNNFIYFFHSVKSIKEYIFPAIIFLTIGLSIVLLSKFLSKKSLKKHLWIFIVLLGILIILSGNRLLFIAINNLWSYDILTFIINGITPYTFLLSCEVTFLVCFILHYFDIKYLKK